MHVIIAKNDGERVEGVLLAASKHTLRVMVPGEPDVLELQNQYGQWMIEAGDPVELESLVADPSLDMGLFSREMFPLTYTAGNGFRDC